MELESVDSRQISPKVSLMLRILDLVSLAYLLVNTILMIMAHLKVLYTHLEDHIIFFLAPTILHCSTGNACALFIVIRQTQYHSLALLTQNYFVL